jgi:hypothetical protein
MTSRRHIPRVDSAGEAQRRKASSGHADGDGAMLAQHVRWVLGVVLLLAMTGLLGS